MLLLVTACRAQRRSGEGGREHRQCCAGPQLLELLEALGGVGHLLQVCAFQRSRWWQRQHVEVLETRRHSVIGRGVPERNDRDDHGPARVVQRQQCRLRARQDGLGEDPFCVRLRDDVVAGQLTPFEDVARILEESARGVLQTKADHWRLCG